MDILRQKDYPGDRDVPLELLPTHAHPNGLRGLGEKQTQRGGPMRDLTET